MSIDVGDRKFPDKKSWDIREHSFNVSRRVGISASVRPKKEIQRILYELLEKVFMENNIPQCLSNVHGCIWRFQSWMEGNKVER
jgi:hypothetical protein